jgi:hypothetical protein
LSVVNRESTTIAASSITDNISVLSLGIAEGFGFYLVPRHPTIALPSIPTERRRSRPAKQRLRRVLFDHVVPRFDNVAAQAPTPRYCAIGEGPKSEALGDHSGGGLRPHRAIDRQRAQGDTK